MLKNGPPSKIRHITREFSSNWHDFPTLFTKHDIPESSRVIDVMLNEV